MKRKLIWAALGIVALVAAIKIFPKFKEKVMGFINK